MIINFKNIKMEKQMKESEYISIKKIVYDKEYWRKNLSWTHQNL